MSNLVEKVLYELETTKSHNINVVFEEIGNDTWKSALFTLTPMMGKPYCISIPIPTIIEPTLIGNYPSARVIKTDTGVIRILADVQFYQGPEVSDTPVRTYEDYISRIFKDNMYNLVYSARRVTEDDWIGANQITLAIKEYINAMPICMNNGLGRDFVLGNRIYFDIPQVEKMSYYEKEQTLIDITKTYFGSWFPTSVSDNMRCEACGSRVDLREFSPFAKYHHHPKRPLPQMLQGLNLLDPDSREECDVPWVVTDKDFDMFGGSFCGKGLNLNTVFLSIPETYEDQIVLSDKWINILTERTHKYTVFGQCLVQKGDIIDKDQAIGIQINGDRICNDSTYDESVVSDIEDEYAVFNGKKMKCKTVSVTTYAHGRNGRKITNRHGGKGIVQFMPEERMPKIVLPNGNNIRADVIVEAASVARRKNIGQLLESLYTLAHIYPHGNKAEDIELPLCIPNKQYTNADISKILTNSGYSSNGISKILWHTGEEVETIAGIMFWLLIEDPHIIGTPDKSDDYIGDF